MGGVATTSLSLYMPSGETSNTFDVHTDRYLKLLYMTATIIML